MMEYLPWSKNVLFDSLKMQKEGYIPTLDIELTAKCTGASCIYCDSKPKVCDCAQKGEMDFQQLSKLILDAKLKGLKWIYTCGLGEPLEDGKFWDIIYLLKENDIQLSMFSNGVFINDIYVAKELKKNNVNIILKMDTFNEEKFDVILGRKGTAKKIYAARDYLLEAGYGAKNGYTDFAFSIVPTSLSIDSFQNVIDFSKKNGIFASVGELEQAGEVIKNNLNNMIGISNGEMFALKQIANKYIEGNYMRPICPCILTGLHIDNLGNCIVDENTGLNCKWFLLNEPHTIILGNIMKDSLDSLFESVNLYRRRCFSEKKDKILTSCNQSYVFGGCGGNPKDIIELGMKWYE